jgi:nitrile hydratase accessory protein
MSPELATDGPAAPLRLNGELVFDAPWQSRVFGITAALADEGRLDWPDFQAALIRRVSAADVADAAPTTGTPDGYWRCWLEALGDVAANAGSVDSATWSDRSVEFANRAPGHDHGHDHSHEHDHNH